VIILVTMDDYQGGETAWCPGCGNFGILTAVKRALVQLNLEPHQVLMVSGIGQASKLPHYMRCNLFDGLHGRILPVATAVKIANPKVTVIAAGGDGEIYGEGGNHLIHTIRRNPDITCLVHDNQVYALTKGQACPTSEDGYVTKTTPLGTFARRFNTVSFAIALGASFVARGYAGNVAHLADLIAQGIQNRGFSLINILQPCVTWNHLNTYQWYGSRVYRLDSSYNPKDKIAAFLKAQEWGEKIPIGVIYTEERPIYGDHNQRIAQMPLIEQPHDLKSYEKILDDFKV
jgi:2-oxoglutarate ferredoxin oxidoreductase subunit beta